MMRKEDIDRWVKEFGMHDADDLLDDNLPRMRAKLDRLDKRIRNILEEIRTVFPDAEYYTADGVFNLLLGPSHDDEGIEAVAKSHRVAWTGKTIIKTCDVSLW
jgi:hypothetical protein